MKQEEEEEERADTFWFWFKENRFHSLKESK